MSLISWIAIYIIIWWLCLFLVLPFGVRNQIDAGEVVEGTDPGAPVIFRIWKKLLVTTILALIVQGLILWALTNPILQEYWR
jgi:predicted secreted protein